MLFATDGLVSRVNKLSSGECLVNIITPQRGRIGVMVKGVNSATNPNRSLSQLFTYGNFEIYEKNKMYWLRGGSIYNPFYNLSSDISKMALATYLCDVAHELTDEDEECEELWRLLLNSIYLVCQEKKEQRLVKSVFEFRAACISGYMPELSSCVYCDCEMSELTYLDVMGGRLVCSDCLAKRGTGKEKRTDFDDINEASLLCPLAPAVLTALRYIAYSDAGRIFSFGINDSKELDDLSRTTETYLVSHLGRSFDSLDFYKAVK